MPNSDQARKEWTERELRYRKIEHLIETRWVWIILSAVAALQTWRTAHAGLVH